MQAIHPESRTIRRHDYQAPAFRVERVELEFDLDPEVTRVQACLHLIRQGPGDLCLDGEELETVSVSLDGRRLADHEFQIAADRLTIAGVADRCALTTEVNIRPARNTTLMGLYVSSGNFFSQCEAQGFRRITWFPDRPDVMARYTVTLRADRKRYPVLLSNGNLMAQGDLGQGRHYARWVDPFPKPSYLFALVAGQLVTRQQHLTTHSGREVLLEIYTEPKDLEKTQHAMDSLIKAIRWDEQRFGLELDLDRFMIVAVGDFNMGAMENKGLNIFNTKYVLATPESATDTDFANVEAVVGHEYFHNWTGNRVTCRDWFQLTLKEGLTVFRDQEFSADVAAGLLDGKDDATARAVRRIEDVRALRTRQFLEDAGPMAHPVRPDSYQEISNFYTATVYEKGAEVIRMMQTLLGRDAFRLGMDEYFRRHDGEAVTCDDFVAAMESVYQAGSGKNLDQFRRWYSQAGTPRVRVSAQWDAARREYSLTLEQSCPPVGVERLEGSAKLPFHIPVAVGLVDAHGNDLVLRLANEPPAGLGSPGTRQPTTRVLDFTEATQTFVFCDIDAPPVASLLRDFSAPVILETDQDETALTHLSACDSDPFNRWEAGQRLAGRVLVRLAEQFASNDQPARPRDSSEAESASLVAGSLVEVFRGILRDAGLHPALKELALTLPDENVIGEQMAVYAPQAVQSARIALRRTLAQALHDDWLSAWEQNTPTGPWSPDPLAAGRRALRHCALGYLMELEDEAHHELAWTLFQNTDNMTDRLAALEALVNHPAPQRTQALDEFYRLFEHDALALDKWLRLQATARPVAGAVLDDVRRLLAHPAYLSTNPNKIHALVGAFFNANPAAFHRADGSGYTFWSEQLLVIDRFNPQVAARLARALDRWQKLPDDTRAMARQALQRIHDTATLSRDVAEIIDKSLNA